LEFPVAAQLPNDEHLVGSSVNLGQPFVLSSQGKPLSRAVIALADELVPHVTGSGAKKRSGRWFSFMQ
jgi:Flp pilus assembly CpaE family ATPase